MNNKQCLIDRMNPFFKILILMIITLIGSTDFKPYASIILTISALVVTSLYSSLSIRSIIQSVKGFLFMSIGFMSIILITRAISGEKLYFTIVVGLGFRIILISIYSTIFVKTTDPTEFVLVLIKYFKMPVKIGYAFLTAYRFLPTFKDELEVIKYAHQVRGVGENKNLFIRIWNSQRYIIPMMGNAVRKGIRISMAMETRGFGKYKTRTTYRKLDVNKGQIFIFLIYTLYIIVVVSILHFNNFTSFGIRYKI